MTTELLIRPGHNDHDVIADLLAPGGAAVLLPQRRRLIDRLVVDAHLAARRPQFAAVAASAGVPLLIDPLTPLWQGELRPDDAWAKLPFGQPQPLGVPDVAALGRRAELVAAVVDFQLAHGATAIIPPYPYATAPSDPWFEEALELIRATARYLRAEGVALPLVPILCAKLQQFGSPTNWAQGVERFGRLSADLGAAFVGACLTPISPNDSYGKLERMFSTMRRLRETSGRPVIAWRQGVYGAGLTAAGLDGYETGIATSEQCDVLRLVRSRRPRPPGAKPTGGQAPGIYIEPLGRSVTSRVGHALLELPSMRPKVMCVDDRCCPSGVRSTLEHRREHAVRTRARMLALMDALPHSSWRLHQIAKDAQAGATLAVQANEVLAAAGLAERLPVAGLESLARVARHLRAQDVRVDAA